MPVPIIAAGIAAAGTIGGAVLSSNSQKSAAAQATQATTNAQNQATQAQLQLGQQSLQQTGDIYKSNYNLLSPFVSNGLAASNNLNALLNLPKGPTLTPPTTIGSGTTPTTPTTGNALGTYPTPTTTQHSSGGIPAIISPVGALLTGGGIF